MCVVGLRCDCWRLVAVYFTRKKSNFQRYMMEIDVTVLLLVSWTALQSPNPLPHVGLPPITKSHGNGRFWAGVPHQEHRG